MTLKTRLSIRIDSEFGCEIETKQIALLETIQRQGSIAGAAKLLGLSYRGTQNQIDVINKALHEPAVSTHSGGLKGGGAALTPSESNLSNFTARSRGGRKLWDCRNVKLSTG